MTSRFWLFTTCTFNVYMWPLIAFLWSSHNCQLVCKLLVHLSITLLHLSLYLPVYPPVYPSILHPHLRFSNSISFHLSVCRHETIYQSNHPHVYPSNSLSDQLSNSLFITFISTVLFNQPSNNWCIRYITSLNPYVSLPIIPYTAIQSSVIIHPAVCLSIHTASDFYLIFNPVTHPSM